MREYPEYKEADRRGRCLRIDNPRILYINNPRAASSGCRNALGRAFSRGGLGNYLVDEIDLDEYFKFSVVRDPVSRFISTFVYLSYSKEWHRDRSLEYGTKAKAFFRHPRLDATKMELFLDEVEKNFWDPHTQPQCWWLSDSHFNLIELDHVFLLGPALASQFREFFVNKFGATVVLRLILPTPPERRERAVEIFASEPAFLRRVKKLYACDFELYLDVKRRYLKDKDESDKTGIQRADEEDRDRSQCLVPVGRGKPRGSAGAGELDAGTAAAAGRGPRARRR
jgi:hypothetical protein